MDDRIQTYVDPRGQFLGLAKLITWLLGALGGLTLILLSLISFIFLSVVTELGTVRDTVSKQENKLIQIETKQDGMAVQMDQNRRSLNDVGDAVQGLRRAWCSEHKLGCDPNRP